MREIYKKTKTDNTLQLTNLDPPPTLIMAISLMVSKRILTFCDFSSLSNVETHNTEGKKKKKHFLKNKKPQSRMKTQNLKYAQLLEE